MSEETLRKVSPNPPGCKTPPINDIIKEEIKLEMKKTEIKKDIPDSIDDRKPPPDNCQPKTKTGLVGSMSGLKPSESDTIKNESNSSAKEISPLPENSKVIGKDLENVIEAELVPAVQDAKTVSYTHLTLPTICSV